MTLHFTAACVIILTIKTLMLCQSIEQSFEAEGRLVQPMLTKVTGKAGYLK